MLFLLRFFARPAAKMRREVAALRRQLVGDLEVAVVGLDLDGPGVGLGGLVRVALDGVGRLDERVDVGLGAMDAVGGFHGYSPYLARVSASLAAIS